MRTDPLPRLVLICLTILSITGCSTATPAKQPSPGASSDRAGQPRTPAAANNADGPPEAWLLVGRLGEPDLHLVAAANGQVMMDLPAGSPRSISTWDRILTTTTDGQATIVRDIAVASDVGGPELRIGGHWRLPAVGLDPIPGGRSIDGSTIVLVEGAYDPSAGRSRFAVVEHHLADAVATAGDAPLRLVRIVTLKGAFEYDTLSPDGRILYVVQHLDRDAGGLYQVRAVDVATGVMRDAVIVDKTRQGETMAGSAIAQVRRPDGLVLTLYRGPEHPFIHALNSREAWAVCIDLPAGGTDDAAASLDWGLTPSIDGLSVFAVNASLGLAVDVDPAELAVRRSASIGTSAEAPIVLAKFGHGEVGQVGRRLVVSPDGTRLFAAGTNGITVIRTKDLVTVRQDLAGSAVDSLGITPDGVTIFALLRDATIVARDAATGRELGTVPGHGFDRLLAVAPW
jgi:hypothetical protein